VYEAVRKTIAAEKCSVVFYDSISRAGFGSLVADDTANRIMDMLATLSPTWVALAHSPRGDDSHTFGSQMFDAAAELAVRLTSEPLSDRNCLGVSMEITKANDTKTGQQAIHAFEVDEQGLTSVRQARLHEFAGLETGRKKTRNEEVRDYLATAGEATASEVAEALGSARNHTSALLNGLAWVSRRKQGREVFFALADNAD
jgi:hypothetical protein